MGQIIRMESSQHVFQGGGRDLKLASTIFGGKLYGLYMSSRRHRLSTIVEQVTMNEHRTTMEKQWKVKEMRTKLEVENEDNNR
uniref:Uncharacterized protein n=1 Tax=Lactuca sativa TaxID=4236 RepID=A0A9R1X3Y9_LACSA|nr:hypothetical protein LSAT_V11C700349790 [Lactuca sativa]